MCWWISGSKTLQEGIMSEKRVPSETECEKVACKYCGKEFAYILKHLANSSICKSVYQEDELNSLRLSIKPLFLPIFKNLFFLSFKISSEESSLKYSKFLDIDIPIFFNIKSLSLWAPPNGSEIISSIILSFSKSLD